MQTDPYSHLASGQEHPLKRQRMAMSQQASSAGLLQAQNAALQQLVNGGAAALQLQLQQQVLSGAPPLVQLPESAAAAEPW